MRGFGVEPDAIRLLRRRYNVHWLVRSGPRRFVLRRFGVWRGAEDDPAWEVAWVRRLAEIGLPVPAPICEPRLVDGALHMLMPFLAGRIVADGHATAAGYRAIGRELAHFHAAIAEAPLPAQRPGYGETVAGALPVAGGRARRGELLAALARCNAAFARAFAEAADALEARDLPRVFEGRPRLVAHGDLSPWNVRYARGRLTGLIDFELSHVDVRAADLAASRRGWHDAVVDGYLEVAPLAEAELAALDGLWLGGVLSGVWRVLEDRITAGEADLDHGLDWNYEQLAKTRPYLG